MKRDQIPVWGIMAFLILFWFGGCGKNGSEWGGSITQNAGVVFVKNPIEPKYGPEVFSMEEELSFGESEGRDEYMFQEVTGIEP